MFDLLIKGGHVIDPASGLDGKMDIALKRNRIAAVDKNIPKNSALEIIDATRQYVTPGFIDLHTHVYTGVTFWGIDADSLASRTGVTTWIDAGSAGAYTLSGFRDSIIKPASVRIYSLLNISAIGLVPSDFELTRVEWCDVGLFQKIANKNRDIVLGIKVRMGIPTAGKLGMEPLIRARLAADKCGLPIMVHIAWAPPALKDVIAQMKPGDILTHCFTGLIMRIVDVKGRIFDFVKRAWDNGMIMDIGHGAGSFSFDIAEALMEAGYQPDVISTDVHQVSINGPMFDLPTCMSKFLYLGMSLSDVVSAVTINPAKAVRLEGNIGSIRPGLLADLSFFTVESGRFLLYDSYMNVRKVEKIIQNTRTIVNGRSLDPEPPKPPAPWIDLTDAQRAYYASIEKQCRFSPVQYLNKPEHFGSQVPFDRGQSPHHL